MLFLFCNPCVMVFTKDKLGLGQSRNFSSMFYKVSASTFGLCSSSGSSTLTTLALLVWHCFLGSRLFVCVSVTTTNIENVYMNLNPCLFGFNGNICGLRSAHFSSYCMGHSFASHKSVGPRCTPGPQCRIPARGHRTSNQNTGCSPLDGGSSQILPDIFEGVYLEE